MNGRFRQRGTAAVEAAIVLLGFLFLLFGTMEIGRLLNVYSVMTDAAREAARRGVTPLTQTSTLPTTGDLTNWAQGYLQSAAIQNATIQINQNFSCGSGPLSVQCTQVSITVPYNVISLSAFSPLTVNLKANAVMRNETSSY
jgi:Flp pilus assembly protein TadG